MEWILNKNIILDNEFYIKFKKSTTAEKQMILW